MSKTTYPKVLQWDIRCHQRYHRHLSSGPNLLCRVLQHGLLVCPDEVVAAVHCQVGPVLGVGDDVPKLETDARSGSKSLGHVDGPLACFGESGVQEQVKTFWDKE